MPLPNDATLEQVVTALQNMTGINQQSELATVIGAPTLITDAVGKQVGDIQTQKTSLASKLSASGKPSTGAESLKSLVDKAGTLLPPAIAGPVNAYSITDSFGTTDTTLTNAKRFQVKIAGTYQIKTNLITRSGLTAVLQLYLNNALLGPRRSHSSVHPAEYTETATLQVGDVIQVAILSGSSNEYVYNTLLALGISQPNPYATTLLS
ncbi:hypothetical protein [Sporosarcina sp. NPDC096371]|uniref:hypothetical protein n=1 Tax=Sporosarcina sp. NPDC096371 TaxID=3364530 RepID=UPI0038251FF2